MNVHMSVNFARILLLENVKLCQNVTFNQTIYALVLFKKKKPQSYMHNVYHINRNTSPVLSCLRLKILVLN